LVLNEIAEKRRVSILKCMNLAPSWDLYRTFLAILEEGSLSGAARALGLTQPTIARHLDALEASLGLELFVRSQQGLSPTEAALELGPHAEMLAATAAALLRTASGHGSEVRGSVRISASEVIGVEVLPPILAELRRVHPALTFELVLSNAVDNLLRRDADMPSAWSSPCMRRSSFSASARSRLAFTPAVTIWSAMEPRQASTICADTASSASTGKRRRCARASVSEAARCRSPGASRG
jgi:DNA-binding transcriptional LysR family regulator